MQEYLSPISSNVVYEKIYNAALKLLYQLTPEKTYSTIVNEAKKLVGAVHCSIFLFEDGELKRVFTSSPELSQIKNRKNGRLFSVYKTQKPSIVSSEQLIRIHSKFRDIHFGSSSVVPFTYNNKTLGVLSLLSPKDVIFNKDDLSKLLLFAPVVSLAIRNMQLYSQAKKSLEERDLFISMAAHELKTPLTTASIYSQLLLRKTSNTKYSETQIKMKLSNEIARLTSLVNELLQVNQIKTGNLKFTFKKCDLCSVIDAAITAFENINTDYKVNFKNELKNKYCFTIGDFDKLFQVITNLLNNAAKFSPKQIPIDIVLSYSSSTYLLTITDHGSGIKKKDLPRIFERFYKGNSQTKDGLGLGLFLVKNIIERHKGEIFVTSKPRKGTTFSIRLPLYIDNA